jgi:hypothetical protein
MSPAQWGWLEKRVGSCTISTPAVWVRGTNLPSVNVAVTGDVTDHDNVSNHPVMHRYIPMVRKAGINKF